MTENTKKKVHTTIRMDEDLHAQLSEKVYELGKGLPPRHRPTMDRVIQAAISMYLHPEDLAQHDHGPPESVLNSEQKSTIENQVPSVASKVPAAEFSCENVNGSTEIIRGEEADWVRKLLFILRGNTGERAGIARAIKENISEFFRFASILAKAEEARAAGVDDPQARIDYLAEAMRILDPEGKYDAGKMAPGHGGKRSGKGKG